MTTTTRRYHFCASHRLHSPLLSENENQRIYGKCNNPYGHGHDYSLDVSVSGDLNSTTGVIVRLPDLDRLVASQILQRLAYRNLNVDVPEFLTLVPTTENLAGVIAQILTNSWSDFFPTPPPG